MKLTPEMRTAIVAAAANLFCTSAFAHETPPAVATGSERCYGVAKAGQNACATAKHACSGLAAKDKAPDEWIDVPKGSCAKQGGQLAPPRA